MIFELMRACAERTPHAPFLLSDQGEYDFARVQSLARRFAQRLRKHGIRPGDHVALLAGNSAAYVVTFLGIGAAGAVAVTLNNQLIADSIDYLVGQCDAKLIVADTAWLSSRLHYLKPPRADLPIVEMASETSFFSDLDGLEEGKIEPRSAADICAILYTSGTTGLPKGVLCTHGGHVAVGHQTATLLGLTAADRTMLFLPLFHTNPQMYGLMSALTVGSSLAIRPKFSAQNFFEDAARFGATGCTFVGTVLSILLARFADRQRDHKLRFALGGGTTREMVETIADRFGFTVFELYGMTETGGWTTGNTVDAMRLGSNGRPRGDMDVRIVDANDDELAPGGKGEIVVRPTRPHVMLAGYYNKPDQMVAACRNLWFHTGDVGSMDSDGYLYFHGRSKELIRRAGEMISPVELELILRKMPGVQDCAVVGVADPIVEEEIKAIVVGDHDLTAPSVREFMAGHVPAGMLPRYVEFADAIPKTETEKILRRQLQYVDHRVVDLGGRKLDVHEMKERST